MGIFVLTLAAFGLIALMMSVGVMFSGRCIRGSCGGEEVIGPNGELLNCDTCPVRKERAERIAGDSKGTRIPLNK